MSKKHDPAASLAGIIKARRGEEAPVETTPAVEAPVAREVTPTPSPAPLPPPAPVVVSAPARIRSGKSSDKANYSQYSVYLRKDTRKKVGRALDDADSGQDFSELVQELLEKWLKSRT